MRFSGHCGLQTASEVKYKIRFEIYGPNYLCHHVYFACFDLLLESDRRKKKKEHLRLLDLSASPQVKKDLLVLKCSSFWIYWSSDLLSLRGSNELKCCFSFILALPFPLETAVIITKLDQNANSTWCSQVVSHPSTDQAQQCLTSVFRRELVYSMWYGRCQKKEWNLSVWWCNHWIMV